MQLTPDDRAFIIDPGASIMITSCLTDFNSHPQPVTSTVLKGIASGFTIEGLGLAVYSFIADDCKREDLQLANIL